MMVFWSNGPILWDKAILGIFLNHFFWMLWPPFLPLNLTRAGGSVFSTQFSSWDRKYFAFRSHFHYQIQFCQVISWVWERMIWKHRAGNGSCASTHGIAVAILKSRAPCQWLHIATGSLRCMSLQLLQTRVCWHHVFLPRTAKRTWRAGIGTLPAYQGKCPLCTYVCKAL